MRRYLASAAAALLSVHLLTGASLAHPVSFEPSFDIVGGNQAYPTDRAPEVVTDGAGTWIVAWVEENPPDYDEDLYAIRSVDNGRTWSAPAPLNASAAGDGSADDRDVTLVGHPSGTWLAVWTSNNTLGGTIGSDFDVLYARSLDGGATWSMPLPLNDDAAVDSPTSDDFSLVVRGGGNNTAVAMWRNELTETIESSRSTDLGVSWSPPVVIAGLLSFGKFVWRSRLASDGAGTWVHVWVEHNEEGLYEVHSSDDGASWSPAVAIDVDALNPGLGFATDGLGTWIVAFDEYGGPGGGGKDLFCRRSLDGGATWTAREVVDPNAHLTSDAYIWEVALAYDAGSSGWLAAWSTNGMPFASFAENDVAYTQSFDAGATWERSATLTPGEYPDGREELWIELASDGDGTWVAAIPYGATKMTLAASLPDCSPTPLAGCRTPTSAGKSAISIKSEDGREDALKWKWTAGQATDLVDFADPTANADYVLCAYESFAGVPRVAFEKDVAAGVLCSDLSCWEQGSNGYRYYDKGRTRSSVSRLDLRAGSDGKAKIKMAAGGAGLAPPKLPLAVDAEVTVQLVNRANGNCWSATYSTGRNDENDFRARSDAP